MRVCFLVPELGRSGGIGVVVEHAARLAADHGFETELVLTSATGPVPASEHGVSVRTLEDARGQSYDFVLATWWETARSLYQLNARRRGVFLQSIEQRFYRSHELAERLGAAVVLRLPVDYIVVAPWMAELLAELRPDARCRVVANGIDKAIFAPRPPQGGDGPLRILIEGQPSIWLKGVHDAVRVVAAMEEPALTTVVALDPLDTDARRLDVDRVVGGLDPTGMAELYAETDVVLKLARFEGLGLAPIEAFHLGVPCVVTPYPGQREYVVHGENGVVVGFDDDSGTAHWLDLLARDRGLLARLSEGALEAAGRWPDLDTSSRKLAEALTALVEEPVPAPESGVGELLRALELTTELELQQVRLELRQVRLEFEGMSAYYDAALTEARAHVRELSESREECARMLDDSRRQLVEVTESRAYRTALAARRALDRMRP